MKIFLMFLAPMFFMWSCGNRSNSFKTIQVIQTSAAGDYYQSKGDFLLEPASANDTGEVIVIDPEQTYQDILGFGGAFTEASAFNLQKMSPEKRNEILQAYFSPQGAHYSLTRTHINSCDFSLSSYSYDDVEGDTELDHFSIAPDRDDLIPLIKAAMAVDGASFKIVASPWTAPPWMKDNNNWFGGSLKHEYYPVWANYLVKYIKAYAQEGIPIWAVTVENEPLGNGNAWESMIFTPLQMANFVGRHLGPVFQDAGLDTKIMIYDQNRDHLKEWADIILSDSLASQYTWGTAVHWYSSTYEWYPETLEEVHRSYPDKKLLHTEACIDSETPVWEDDSWYWKKEATDWGFVWAPEEDKYLHPAYVPVYRYARDIIGGLNSWLTGWIDWNIVLDKQGGPNHVKNWCIAPVIVDPDSDQVYYTPLFYVMKHFSRHIRPGAKRIGVKGDFGKLMINACRNADGGIVVSILNQQTRAVDFSLKIGTKSAKLRIDGQALETLLIQ